RGRIARPIRKEDGVGIPLEDGFGRAGAGKQRQPASALRQAVDDRGLDTRVQRDDVRPVFATVFDRGRWRHGAGEVEAFHRRLRLDQLAGGGFARLSGKDAAAHRPLLADVADEGAGVHSAYRRNPLSAKPVEPTLSPTRPRAWLAVRLV